MVLVASLYQNRTAKSFWKEETESDSTNMIWKLFEIRHFKLLTVSEFARYQGTSEKIGVKT